METKQEDHFYHKISLNFLNCNCKHQLKYVRIAHFFFQTFKDCIDLDSSIRHWLVRAWV